MRRGNRSHIRGKLAESLVEIIHLREDADYDNDRETIGRWMCELIVAPDR